MHKSKWNKVMENEKSFSCLTPQPDTIYGRKVYASAWGNFVSDNGKVNVRCDLTFRKCVEIVTDGEWIDDVCIRTLTRDKTYITDAIAYETIGQLCDRLNYASYKHAYKRYGKKLNYVSTIEGGDNNLRENGFTNDKNKRLHAHLLFQLPTHIQFDTFKRMIIDYWRDTIWGYYENSIEEIKTIKGSANYNVKSTLDNADLTNIYFKDSV
jgi:hypothetical protein